MQGRAGSGRVRVWRGEGGTGTSALEAFAEAAEELVGLGSGDSNILHWMFVDQAEQARLGQLSGQIPEDYQQGRAIVTVAHAVAEGGIPRSGSDTRPIPRPTRVAKGVCVRIGGGRRRRPRTTRQCIGG